MNPELLRKLGLHDKKRLSLMVCLVAFGLLLWGRLLLKQVPRTAVAEPAAAAAVEASPQPAATAAVEEAEWLTVHVDVPAAPVRDLFALDASRYARVAPPEPPEPAGAGSAPLLEIVSEPAKSDHERADQTRRIHAVRRAATGLILQSTILGERPRAVIDGQTVAPGQSIKGFEVRRVMPRRVILEMDGIEIYLDM